MPEFIVTSTCNLWSVQNVYGEILDKLKSDMEQEERKYPMTDKEKILYNALCSILDKLSKISHTT